MNRNEIMDVINTVLKNQGRQEVSNEEVELISAGFRSLDFAEAAVRIEECLGCELNFGAAAVRQIRTVKDIIDFFVDSTKA